MTASITSKIVDALSFTGGMTWEILWALILGFALSAAVQAVVTNPIVLLLHDSTVFPLVAVGILVSAAAGVVGFAFAGLRGAAREQLLVTLRDALGLRRKAPAEV